MPANTPRIISLVLETAEAAPLRLRAKLYRELAVLVPRDVRGMDFIELAQQLEQIELRHRELVKLITGEEEAGKGTGGSKL